MRLLAGEELTTAFRQASSRVKLDNTWVTPALASKPAFVNPRSRHAFNITSTFMLRISFISEGESRAKHQTCMCGPNGGSRPHRSRHLCIYDVASHVLERNYDEYRKFWKICGFDRTAGQSHVGVNWSNNCVRSSKVNAP